MLLTLLLWAVMFVIYSSSRHNKTNQWCAMSGLILSLGPLKEFFYYDLAPQIVNKLPFTLPVGSFYYAYNIMTAILYNLAMPFSLVFAMHFYGALHQTRIRLFKISAFLPAIVLSFIFSPLNIKAFQLNSFPFWYTMSAYNLSYGIIITVLMIKAVFNEKTPVQRRQKRLVNWVLLPPLWFWLISIFVIHSLGIDSLRKLWKDNTFLFSLSAVIFVIAAFREGILGFRLRKESYQWDTGMITSSKGAQYTSHILKNEITKIEWCSKNLSEKYANSLPEELTIINRSTQHLKQFVNKTQLYSDDFILQEDPHRVADLIESAILSSKNYTGFEITYSISCDDKACLNCDGEHMIEVLNNLISNAADAMDKSGNITIAFSSKKHCQILSVKDEGAGIKKQDLSKLFDPYFTTKKTNTHFGLGLSYCANVMRKHNGYIEVKSEEGKGTTFELCFPIRKRIRFRENAL